MDIDIFDRQIRAYSACSEAALLARTGSKAAREIGTAQNWLYQAQEAIERNSNRVMADSCASFAQSALVRARSHTSSPALRVAIGQARDAVTIYRRTINA